MWNIEELEISEAVGNPIRIYPNLSSVKGILLGMASAPLLLVAVYFFKASPRFFSKEHAISLLSYGCCVFLAGIGTMFYGLPIVIASYQALPLINQLFVGSFYFTIENCFSVCFTIISLYAAAIGNYSTIQIGNISFLAIIGFVAALGVSLLRLSGKDSEIVRRVSWLKLTDLVYMLVFSFEASFAFASVCSFSLVLNAALPFIAVLTSMSFLLPMDKALYYYPATAVIPIFIIFTRLVGTLISIQLYSNTLNVFTIISLVTGVLSSIFPLILL
ncbi:hypothetical protein NEOKW01_0060 [Nematocida sp. AWRm80]|nr:hypothetical protein NEOKW01_0060 [Nematocida sp. AWRm80]